MSISIIESRASVEYQRTMGDRVRIIVETDDTQLYTFDRYNTVMTYIDKPKLYQYTHQQIRDALECQQVNKHIEVKSRKGVWFITIKKWGWFISDLEETVRTINERQDDDQE